MKDQGHAKKITKDRASRTTQPTKSHDNLLGYLVFVFIDETLKYAQECCPGCCDQKRFPPSPRSPSFWSARETSHVSSIDKRVYAF